jgi:anaerobic carbon-monoxide dehydrogenase iron sulfur subunit
MSKVLMIHPEKCTGCRNCELACAFAHDEGNFRLRTTRIHVYTWEREGFSVPMMCNQCESASCMAVCPTGALSRAEAGGVVSFNSAKCIGCRMCTLACPFGCIAYDTATSKVLKCDNCGGEPACVKACPSDAIEYADDTIAIYNRKKAHSAKFKEAFQEAR